MNSKELLEMLGDIDQDMIEDAAPSAAGRERVRKRATNYRMRIAAIAACFVLLVLGVVMLLSVLDITQKPIIPRPDVTDETEGNETEKKTTDETAEHGNIESDETVSGQEVIIPSDTGNAMECPTEQTPPIESEFETEIGFSPEITAPQDTGNVTESPTESAPPIEGEQENDSTECETDDCESEPYVESIIPEIDSLLDIRDLCFDAGGVEHRYMRYSCDRQEDYCKDFLVNGDLLETFVAKMFETDCPVKDGISVESVEADSKENIIFSFYSLCSGSVQILDNGYIVFYIEPLEQKIFDIGRDRARGLIDLVIYDGEPQGYIRNGEKGKWLPIVFDGTAPYPTFNEAIEENKLIRQIEFQEEIDYWETKFGWSPNTLLLDRESRAIVAEIMYRANGDAVVIEDITSVASEGMTFVCVNNLTGSACYMTVCNSGHIQLDKCYYYVGLEYTDAIMNTVRTRCTTYEAHESYFKWNEERECWETYSPEWYESETETRFQDSDITADETRCEESVDIPREYATETDVEIHCETETGIIECAG